MPKYHKKTSKPSKLPVSCSVAASSVPPDVVTSLSAPSSSIFKPVLDPYSIKGMFEPGPHQVNWYVNRSAKIRSCLTKLWNGGPKDKHSTRKATKQQEISTQANVLMRQLEKYGPTPIDWPYTITPDPKHGACNRPDLGCVSKGFYHTHLVSGKLTWVILWEAFESERLINIVAIDSHENFDFARKGHNPVLAWTEARAAAEKANFNPHEKFNHATYNNKVC